MRPNDGLRHFVAPDSISLAELDELLALAADLKQNPLRDDLRGKSVGLVFFNPSLRTRSSMDIGVQQLGGHALTLDVGVGTWKLEHRVGKVMDGEAAEHIIEAARVLSRYVDLLGVRSFPERHSWGEDRLDPILSGFARWAEVPLVNLEAALHHPCQGLADALTIRERLGQTRGEPIVISWAYHPKALPMAVPNTALVQAAMLGMEVRLAHPQGWELDPAIMASAKTLAEQAGGSVRVYDDVREALPGARVVYAKSWGSIPNYRNPDEETRLKLPLRDTWRISMDYMDRTDRGFFMHCLPVRRGVVVDDEVLDSERNAAYDEAENRLHVQKALILRLLGKA
jgi:N-acetylornithine carbamoyltransferase